MSITEANELFGTFLKKVLHFILIVSKVSRSLKKAVNIKEAHVVMLKRTVIVSLDNEFGVYRQLM